MNDPKWTLSRGKVKCVGVTHVEDGQAKISLEVTYPTTRRHSMIALLVLLEVWRLTRIMVRWWDVEWHSPARLEIVNEEAASEEAVNERT